MSRCACPRPAAPQSGPSPQSAPLRPRRRALSAGGCLVALVLALTPALAGCGEATAQGTSPTRAATVQQQVLVAVPDVVGMKGDAAAEALKTAGLTQAPSYTDVDGKESVWEPGNWSVTAQEPAAGAQVPAGQAITLTVNHDSAKAAASARASASAAAAAEASASAAAAEQARQEAARAAEQTQQQTQQPVQTEPDQTQEQSDGSSGTYYANCADAWAAGAAPLHRGDPGYRAGLDRDDDGIACEWKQGQPEQDSSQEQSGGSSGTFYKNCSEARAAGAAPIYRGEPGYREKLDRDNDGIACEWK
ncbi:excalibur calcium-binding domain-containing protein [Actinomyces dentalis]|uniref:excalibur calcium-binding domain-containing protein n=1 Tax=Actinomyces dentalis TaxID=272548 RepID=UPI001FDFD398|nr:excalibur calcium-binding domain-containing protein [Actinomyces dentalis]